MRLLRHLAWKQTGSILVEWEETENKKIDEASTKGKREK